MLCCEASCQVQAGKSGGSGVVIISYPACRGALTSIGVGLTYTVCTVNRPGFRVYKFTAGTGLITW
jgi:hypothetical protein